MNKINKSVFIAVSSLFAIACYAMVDVRESASYNVVDLCAQIADSVKRQECYKQHQQSLN